MNSQVNSQIQLLVFNLDDRQYGLHLAQVQRVIRAVDAAPLPDAPDAVLGAIDLQGTIVPLFNVRKRFGMIEREVSPDDQYIIARSSRRTVALAVDTVKDIIQRPADQIVAAEKILDRMELIAGVLQLEDGLVLIHDLDRFLSLDQERVLDEALVRQSS
jgi:purine-binding chemotaxis protein CheW